MCLFIFLKAYNSEIYSWFNQHFLRYRLSLNHSIYRSSHPDIFCNKGVLKNFRKFKEKNLCWSLSFTNIAGLRLATLLKKRHRHRFFPVNFANVTRTPIYIEQFLWLFLQFKLCMLSEVYLGSC